MRRFRRSLRLAAAAALGFAFSIQAQSATPVRPSDPWVQAASDIPADENVRFGVLPNGMQYAIMRNASPPGQASFRLRIDAGSLMEDETQLGLAHFMEHMAFNGTTHVPENELLRTLERLGLAFGADTNAYTAFEETVYKLELPRADDETVDTALHILREQVSEALMTAEAIDAERGVIEGEQRLRNTPGFRAMKAQLALLAPGQRVSQRLPIGDLDIIRTAPRDRFVAFYNAYYRPDRATFVAVGDFDVDVMEGKIRRAFEDWTPRAADGPEPDLGTVAPRATRTTIVVEPGVRPSIELSWTRPPDRRPDSVETRRQKLIETLALQVLKRRLGELARSDTPPVTSADADRTDLAGSLDVVSISAEFSAGQWRPALEAVERAQRQLVRYGVTEAELDREVTTIRTYLESAVGSATTRRTPLLADSIAGSVNARMVFNSSRNDLDIFNAAVKDLKSEAVDMAARDLFASANPLVLLLSPTPVDGGEAAVTAALTASRAVAAPPPMAPAAIAWPYDDFGPPGGVASRREVPAVGATVLIFANGVRLTVKPTTFREDQILVSVRTGIGARGFPTDRPTPLGSFSSLVSEGGLGRLTADELDRALTGKVYESTFVLEDDRLGFSGATRPEDLDLQLQVLTAFITDPGVRPAPFLRLQSVFPQILDQQAATPSGAFNIHAPVLLAGGDQRNGMPTADEVAAWTNDDLKRQVLEGLASGPIDVVIGGDVTVDQAIKAVAPTLGALPVRPPAARPMPGATNRRFPTGTTEPLRFRHTGASDQAMGYVAWPTTDQMGDRTEARRVSLLAEILNLRVVDEIRERQAIAYSPSVRARASDAYEGYGTLSVSAQTAPGSLPAFFMAVEQIATSLREEPPSLDELTRARRPVVEALRRRQASNEYWISQLADLARDTGTVEQALTAVSDLEAVTPEDIQALARRYLIPGKAWRATVTSELSD